MNARNVIFIMNINNKISFSLRDNLIIMKLIAIAHNIINKLLNFAHSNNFSAQGLILFLQF